MDGRYRTPWPDRPRSSLPSVAWWTGQGNLQRIQMFNGLEYAKRVPTSRTIRVPRLPGTG